MSTQATQLQFTADFSLFLVSFGVVVALALRVGVAPAERAARWAMGTGFAVVGASAFLAGSLLIDERDDPVVMVMRALGLAVVAVATLRWGDARSRSVLWAGVGVLTMALVGVALDIGTAEWAQLAGAGIVGLAVFVSSRTSVSAQVAIAAAATVLLVVVAVSVANSGVLANNVEDEALRRTEARAKTEALLADQAAKDSVLSARIVAAPLSVDSGASLLALLGDPASPAFLAAQSRLQTDLGSVRDLLFAQGPLAYVTAESKIVARVPELPAETLVALAGSRVVGEAITTRNVASAVEVVADRALALAAVPLQVGTGEGRTFAGVVVASQELGAPYLAARLAGETDLAMAFANREQVLANHGTVGDEADVLALVESSLASGESVSALVGHRYTVVYPIKTGDNIPVLGLVASVPDTVVTQTSESLTRSLFVVALVAALFALALAAVAGERLGAGLRRLTTAAGELEGGNLDTRAGLDRDDELGVLGSAFDAMAGSLRGMTADLRLAAEDEARLRGRLQAVVDGMGEALVATDADGRVTQFNQAAEVLTGLVSDDAEGRPVSEVLALRDADGQPLDEVFETGAATRWSGDAVLDTGGGREVPVVLTSGSVRGTDGRAVGGVYVMRDVRREREVEQMKSDFIANISHELRTPLTPIKGYASMLAGRELGADRTKEFAGKMLDSVDQLERLFGQLVNFATIAAGRLNLRTEPVDVRTLLRDAAGRWERRLTEHTVTTRVARTVTKITADRRYVDQALDELIDNAVKYMPEGGRVSLRGDLEEPDGRGAPTVRLSVVDEGVGIEAADLERIFEDFSQADASATRRFGGLGLGLAMVDRIVRVHGGHLTCDSTPGKGSRFAIHLPISDVEAQRAPSGSTARRGSPRRGGRTGKGRKRAKT